MSEETIENIETVEAEVKVEETLLRQEDVDRIVKERLARERNKFMDYDDLKAKAAQLDVIEEANKSELQKAHEDSEKARAELTDLKASLHRQQVIISAIKHDAVNPDQVAALVSVDADSDIDSAVSSFLSENDHMVKRAAPTVPTVSGNETKTVSEGPISFEGMTPEQLAADPALLARIVAEQDRKNK